MRRLRWVWLGLAVLVVLLLVLPELAEARMGGGQGFGRGGGGGGGGGGGDGIPIDLIILLIHLCIEVPAIGIPLTIGVVGFFIVRAFWNRSGNRRVQRSHGARERRPAAPRPRAVPGLPALRERDSGFSMPVLLDYVGLVHRRAHEAIGNGAWAALAPFVADEARKRLQTANEGVVEISELVVGGLKVLKVERRKEYDHLYVQLDSTRTERLKEGAERRVNVAEQWTFRRATKATSLAPDAVERLGCPSCGASIEVTAMGQCRNCDTPITAGQLQWQATFVMLQHRRRAVIPEVGFLKGGDETSVDVPVLSDPQLGARMRELRARHPDFDPAIMGKRVELVYFRLQEAWSTNRWDDARPFVTDRMFQTLRFSVERYSRHGLRNRLEDVELERVRIVKADVDAWYEAVTVRIWGSLKDAIVDADDKVVGGNAKVARRFSEYWTFLRAAGGDGGTKGDSTACPSCGAPLDRISQAGICGYCDAKITTGRFDWVLTRIEQPEAYGG